MGRVLCALMLLLGSFALALGQEQATETLAEIFDEQFKKLDQNGDGQLSKEELAGRPFFCHEGYVFVSVNYRMLPETRVPDQA